jgi:hypothetical protein
MTARRARLELPEEPRARLAHRELTVSDHPTMIAARV